MPRSVAVTEMAVPDAAEALRQAILEVILAEDAQVLTPERRRCARHGLQQVLDGLLVHPTAGDKVRQAGPGQVGGLEDVLLFLDVRQPSELAEELPDGVPCPPAKLLATNAATRAAS